MRREHITTGTKVERLQIREVEQVFQRVKIIVQPYCLCRCSEALHVVVSDSVMLSKLLLEVCVHQEVLRQLHGLEVDGIRTAFYHAATTERDILAHVDISNIDILLIKDIFCQHERVSFAFLVRIVDCEMQDTVGPVAHEEQKVVVIKIVFVEALREGCHCLVLVSVRGG